jgi:hypothetical protein
MVAVDRTFWLIHSSFYVLFLVKCVRWNKSDQELMILIKDKIFMIYLFYTFFQGNFENV